MPPPSTWQEELQFVVDLMRDISHQTDPQELVRVYGDGIDRLFPTRDYISLSRRELQRPWVRITRSNRLPEDINPWKEKSRLPLLQGGILGEWIYSNEPRFDQDFHPDPSDPAFEFLSGIRSYFTMPMFDQGEALNLTAVLYRNPGQVKLDRIPDQLWRANLFGRGVANLVLRRQLAEAYDALDREIRIVGDIQQSLLPRELPPIPGLELAAYYRTSARAGGDYYDVFPLPDGEWGLFIADVSGHGTPAAVMMAVTHALAHATPGPPTPPGSLLRHLNEKLYAGYTSENGSFVTAFYGVYSPHARTLRYASAGHPPARVTRGGSVSSLDAVGGLPLGVMGDQTYQNGEITLAPGDAMLLYTDGISEAMGEGNGELFGEARIDRAVSPGGTSQAVVARIVAEVEAFTRGAPPADDRTILLAQVV